MIVIVRVTSSEYVAVAANLQMLMALGVIQ